MALIDKIDAHYRRNNFLLEEAKSKENKDASTFKSSYIKCGAPFFKDAFGKFAPLNEDYKYRKNVLNEFFPFDMPATNSRWKTKEKVALVKGVKTQMIRYIKSQQSQKLCQEARKTRNNLAKMKFISNNKDLEESPLLDIYTSIQKDYPGFVINWNIISFDDLRSAHSVSECMGMYYSYLRPDLNRDPFTSEEVQILLNMVLNGSYDSWDEIAAALDRRSGLQAFIQYQTTFERNCPSNRRWTIAEDRQLSVLIDQYSLNGNINWNKIGQILPNRNKAQCYNRYQIIYKSLNTKKGIFTTLENRVIMDFVAKYGEDFDKLSKYKLPGRSVTQIKNHYNNALRQKGEFLPWTHEEDKQLVEFVEQNGTNDWRSIADILKTHSRLSCRTRFMTISKFLKRNPECSLRDVPSKPKKITSVLKAKALTDADVEEMSTEVVITSTKDSLAVLEKFKRDQPDLFHLVKGTFNFDMSNRELNVNHEKVQILSFLFDVDDKRVVQRKPHAFTPSQVTVLKEVFSLQYDQNLLREMLYAKIHTQFLMPPNYNTVIGLRATVIKIHEEFEIQGNSPEIVNQSEEYRTSLVKFQKLYLSLFYWSAMLSKIDSAELNHIHFTKYPKNDLTTSDIIQTLNKRNLPIEVGFQFKRSLEGLKVFPTIKKPKLQ